MTHTPKPWHLLPARTLTNVKGPNGEQICQLPVEDKDNANLIAAAPDLLAALKLVLPDLEHYVSTHGPGPDKRLEAARAAIAQTTT